MENEGREATALDHALDVWASGQALLIQAVEDGGLDVLDDIGFVGFLQAFERLRNRTALVDHRVVRDAQARRLSETWTQPNLAGVLVQALRLSHGEAARRVRAAEQTSTPRGAPAPPPTAPGCPPTRSSGLPIRRTSSPCSSAPSVRSWTSAAPDVAPAPRRPSP